MKHKADYGEKENSSFPGQSTKSTPGKTFALNFCDGLELWEAGGPAPSPAGPFYWDPVRAASLERPPGPPNRNRPRGSLLPLAGAVNLSASRKTTMYRHDCRIFAVRQIRKTLKKMPSERKAKLRAGLKGYVEVNFSNSILRTTPAPSKDSSLR